MTADRCCSRRCWCSSPPVRLIPSTGERYTVREIAPGLFVYHRLGVVPGYWKPRG